MCLIAHNCTFKMLKQLLHDVYVHHIITLCTLKDIFHCCPFFNIQCYFKIYFILGCAGSSLLCSLFSLIVESGDYFLLVELRPLFAAAPLIAEPGSRMCGFSR